MTFYYYLFVFIKMSQPWSRKLDKSALKELNKVLQAKQKASKAIVINSHRKKAEKYRHLNKAVEGFEKSKWKLGYPNQSFYETRRISKPDPKPVLKVKTKKNWKNGTGVGVKGKDIMDFPPK